MPDITAHNAPKSDQLDNIDLRDTGPRVFAITGVDVKDPASDQPVIVHLAEFPRPWKPGKNMRRALSHCWSTETDNWVGKRVELYADVQVKFGNDTPGGTRLSRASHINKTVHAPILLGQGKPGTWKVEPLPDEASAAPTVPPALVSNLTAAFEAAGITERDDRLAYVSDLLGRPITSPGDLTAAEIESTVAALQEQVEGNFGDGDQP